MLQSAELTTIPHSKMASGQTNKPVRMELVKISPVVGRNLLHSDHLLLADHVLQARPLLFRFQASQSTELFITHRQQQSETAAAAVAAAATTKTETRRTNSQRVKTKTGESLRATKRC